jgi:hypothetical protein
MIFSIWPLVPRSVRTLSRSALSSALQFPESPFLLSCRNVRGMKRKADGSTARPAKQRPKEPDYCDVEPRRNDNGDIEWPADATAIERARAFLREWYVTLSDRLLYDKPIDISWRVQQLNPKPFSSQTKMPMAFRRESSFTGPSWQWG